MLDTLGRSIDYLRVSITDRCNLRCVYCMPEDGVQWYSHTEILSFEEMLRICGILAGLGVRKIKVTGGEPLVRKGAADFIRRLKEIPGIEQVTMTTNGVLLAEHLHELRDAGLDALNISLDTVEPEIYNRITRKDSLKETLNAIDLACELGIPVKINCVPIREQNVEGLTAIAALAIERNIHVRFIELMPIGFGGGFRQIPADEVRRLIEIEFGKLTPFGEKLGNGPAKYYSAEGFKGKIGFISAVSHEFCGVCNRLRLTSEGLLKACLAYDIGVDVKELLREGATDSDLEMAVKELISKKPAGHDFLQRGESQSVGADEMFRIGG